MTGPTLTLCADCGELRPSDRSECPACGAETSPPGRLPPVLATMGMVLIAGCTESVALYGVVCTDSCPPYDPCGPSSVDVRGVVGSVQGNPFDLDGAAVGTSVQATLSFERCTNDSDPSDAVGVFVHSADTGFVDLTIDSNIVRGSLAPTVTVQNQAVDVFRYEGAGDLSWMPSSEVAVTVFLEIRDPSGQAIDFATLQAAPWLFDEVYATDFQIGHGGGTVTVTVNDLEP